MPRSPAPTLAPLRRAADAINAAASPGTRRGELAPDHRARLEAQHARAPGR